MIRICLFILIFLQISSCSLVQRFICKETVWAQAESPDGSLIATWVDRDCGATTAVGSMVVLHRPDQGFGHEGVFVVYGPERLELEWIGPEHLLIECEECTRNRILRLEMVSGRTDIFYELPRVERFSQRQ